MMHVAKLNICKLTQLWHFIRSTQIFSDFVHLCSGEICEKKGKPQTLDGISRPIFYVAETSKI